MIHTATKGKCALLLVGVACIFSFVFFPSQTHAVSGINEEMSYQGRLLDDSGAVVPDGIYNMEFKIYQDGHGCESTGTSPCSGTLEWTETRTSTNRVRVVNGYFSVQLGSVTPFGTSVDWNQSVLWLSINIGGTSGTPSWDGEMLPFRRLTATPYALNAGKLGGLNWNQFVQLAPGTIQTDGSTLSSIAINKTGASGHLLQLQNSGGDMAIITHDGFVLSSGLDAVEPGALDIGTTNANSINIGNALNNTPVSIDSGTGTINIGTGAQARTINFGTGSAAQTINIGSSNSATSATIRGGAAQLVVQNTGLTVLGGGTNGAGGQISFGDAALVYVGESGAGDSDVLALRGNLGVQLFTSSTTSARLSISGAGAITVGQSDTTGALLVLDTKTNAGDPTGTNGGMYYNSNAGKFRCFEASAWKDCIDNELMGRTVAQLRRAAVQSIPNNTSTEISWDTQDYLPFGGHSTVTNPGRFTPSTAGRYTIYAKAGFSTNATGRRALQITKNGTVIDGSFRSIMTSPDGTGGVDVSITVSMNGTTDYITALALQTSGAALNLTNDAAASSTLIVTYSGP